MKLGKLIDQNRTVVDETQNALAHEINTPLGAVKSNNHTVAVSLVKIKGMLDESDGVGGQQLVRLSRLVDAIEELAEVDRTAIERIAKKSSAA